MMRATAIGVAALWAVGLALFSGCASAPAKPAVPQLEARFYLEINAQGVPLISLPQSGVQVAVGPKPVITEFDIVNVELAQVELGRCLLFQLTPAAGRDLYRISVANQGRRLVLFLNNAPIGARRIEQPLAGAAIMIFVEQPDSTLPALVEKLKAACVEAQRIAAKR